MNFVVVFREESCAKSRAKTVAVAGSCRSCSRASVFLSRLARQFQARHEKEHRFSCCPVLCTAAVGDLRRR